MSHFTFEPIGRISAFNISESNKMSKEEEKSSLENGVDENKNIFEYADTLSSLGRKITSSLKADDIYQNLFKCLANLMDTAEVELGIYNKKVNKYFFLSNIKTENAYANEASKWVVENNRELISNYLKNEYTKYFYEPIRTREGKEVQSLIAFPLSVEGKISGVLSVMSYNENSYTDFNISMVRSLLSYIAVAIDNSLVYEELNNTQQQLVKQEKLASLGQLTAGIAHEIQNPLNFVNNFSKLSVSLVEELKEIFPKTGEIVTEKNIAEMNEVLKDIEGNMNKIEHHGKRADRIVKSMLSQSRSNQGENSLTNFNALLDEYTSLAYHGLRGKDSNFNCEIKRSFDESIKPIMAAQQNIGRVFLNILNNAFYAVNERQTKEKEGFIPLVSVSTQLQDNNILVKIFDNGGGIPDSIKAKIFDPFFTTKPSGEGTGLGLSLSFDIVKSCDGDIEINTVAGESSEFVISFPSADK